MQVTQIVWVCDSESLGDPQQTCKRINDGIATYKRLCLEVVDTPGAKIYHYVRRVAMEAIKKVHDAKEVASIYKVNKSKFSKLEP